MKSLVGRMLSVLSMLLVFSVSAEIIVYDFKDPVLEACFNQLTQELRCPKCQNNNLADSNATLSVDLKDLIFEKLHQGQSDEQIVGFLTERYGDFITYRPPLQPNTWGIWFGPFLLLVTGGFLIFRFVSSRTTTEEPQSSPVKSSMSEADRQRLLADWKREAQADSADQFSSEEEAERKNKEPS